MIDLARLKSKIVIVSILIGLLTFLPACSSKNKQAKKPQTSSQQKTKAPNELKTILTDLDKIISGLDQKIKAEKTSNLQKSTQLEGQTQQGQQQQSKQSGQQGQQQQSKQSGQQGQQQGQQGQGGQQGQSQQSQQSKTSGQSQGGQQNQKLSWEQENTGVKNIHSNWNKLEPEAIKAGLSTTDRDSFESALEKLTMAVSSQKKQDSLTAAIDLYGQYANIIKVFNMTVPAEFFQVKYEVMTAVDKAGKKEWSAAQEHIPKIQEAWTNLKVKAQSKDGKSLNQTEFSIHDLEQAIKSKQQDLLMIKAEIVMNNLQQMQKELSSQSSGGTSS